MKKMIRVLCLTVCVVMMLTFCGCDMGTGIYSEQGGAVADVKITAAITTTTNITTTTEETTEKTTVTTTKETTAKAPTTQLPTLKKTTVKQTTVTEAEEYVSGTVYVTPTGKRYHLDPDCGGKNAHASTLDAALNSGLTPCKKCAQ